MNRKTFPTTSRRIWSNFPYVDHLSGESDELEVRLEDVDGRWRGPWYPGKGDKLRAEIGYAGEKFLPCGEFEIDEIGWSFPPDEVSIRALATGISTPSRTRKSKGYEKTTLAAVIRAVAKRLGLTPAGEVADIPIDRVTQYQESNLAFLETPCQRVWPHVQGLWQEAHLPAQKRRPRRRKRQDARGDGLHGRERPRQAEGHPL